MSARVAKGNTGAVLAKISAELRFEIVDLSECDVTHYDYAHANRADGFEPLICKLLEHDQIIFAAPVYWYSVPPQMKSFIDRLTDLLEVPELHEKGRQLRGKRAFVVATSGFDEIAPAFISMFRDTFAYLACSTVVTYMSIATAATRMVPARETLKYFNRSCAGSNPAWVSCPENDQW